MPIHDALGHKKRFQSFLRNRSDSAGRPRSDLWRQGLLDFNQLDVDPSVLWTPLGPGPLSIESQIVWDDPPTADKSFQGFGPDSGEVTDIAIDPTGAADLNLYIATNDGGIWTSSDGGATWYPATDSMLSLSMGAVALDPVNPQIVYAGTGNPFDGGEVFTKGIGIYRSNDGGDTWNLLDGGQFDTVFAGLLINRIVVLQPDLLLVATDQGLYRSIDGGQNFGAVLEGFITCLLADSANPKTGVFAGVKGLGVFKSTDGGASFTNRFHNALAQPFSNVEIAQSESNPQRLLLSVQYSPPSGPAVYRGLFASLDGGETWNADPIADLHEAAGDGFDQTWYDLTLGIDPRDPNRVYAGFQELWRSTDGGLHFDPQAGTWGQVHWDHHAIAFSPPNHRVPNTPTTVYVGTDGGISKSTDGGVTWTAINGAISSNLFFGIDIGKGAGSAYTYGGCQDTGTSAHRPADAGTTMWHLGIDGDGYQVAVDYFDPKIVYGFDDSSFIKSIDAGATFRTNNTSQMGSLPIGNNLPLFANTIPTRALALDQTGADPLKRIVYVAYNQSLYKSSDAGESFGPSTYNASGPILTVATSAADPNLVWVGTAATFENNGTTVSSSVHVSRDGGATWDQSPISTMPGTGSVTSIAIDPANPARVAAAYSGQSGINAKYRTKRVFLTIDNGVSWADVSGSDGNGPAGNLPDLPVHSVVFDASVTPSALIVANDAGVMRSTGGSWRIYGAGLPNVSCSSLAIDNSLQPPVLRVGTYGRGCFEVYRPSGPAISVDANLGFGYVAAGRKSTLPVYIYNCGDAPLVITGITNSGSADFSLASPPSFPITVAPGGSQTLAFVFAPAGLGDQTAAFQIAGNDPNSPYNLPASGKGVAAQAPRLATNPACATGFGEVYVNASRAITLQLFNTGTQDLHVSAITVSPDFSLDPAPVVPVTIAPGAEFEVTLKFQPSRSGYAQGTVEIASDEPRKSRQIQLHGTGIAPT
jgi:hypothetical protein